MAAVRAPVRTKRTGRPPLRVLKGQGKGLGRRLSPVPVVICVVLTVFGVTAVHAAMSQEGVRAAKLEREVSEETERLTLLRARVAQLSNAGRLADEAAKLGLVGDPDARFLRVPLEASERLRPVAPGQPSRDPIKSLGAGSR
jgi:cell division protein FtsL